MKPARSKTTGGKPLLICFAGIDGSGKTTHAKKLVRWMQGRGIRSKYVWSIFEPWLLGPLMKLGRRLFLREEEMFGDYDRYYQTRKEIFRYPGIFAFFHYCFFGEYLLRFLFKVRLPLMWGRSVVCDRYIYDVVIGHAANLDYPKEKITATINQLLYLMPKPDLVFLIDLPEELAWARKDDIPSISYLRKRRQIYLDIAGEYGTFMLDGSRSLAELEEVIRNRVRDCLEEKKLT